MPDETDAPAVTEKPLTEVVVVVKENQIGRTQKVADALRTEGMVVDDVLSGYGAVVGQAEEGKIEDLAKIRGVERIEREDEVSSPTDEGPEKEPKQASRQGPLLS